MVINNTNNNIKRFSVVSCYVTRALVRGIATRARFLGKAANHHFAKLPFPIQSKNRHAQHRFHH